MFTSRHQACLAAARLRADRSGSGNSAQPEPCVSDRARRLDGLLWDGSQVPVRDRGTLALLAFSQGNGFLPGQIIDRRA